MLRLRLASPVAVLTVVLALGAVAIACKTKGNGIGTAPENVACPIVRPKAADPCPDPRHVGLEATVCDYDGSCSDEGASGQAFFFCPGGTNAAWKCLDGTDAGPTDASTDVGDGETSDDADAGETSSDAADAPDGDETTTDAAETSLDDAPDAPDAGDALDGAPDADALTD